MASALGVTAVLVAALALLLPGLYTYAAGTLVPARFPPLRNKRICLLIAHPDDEAMFFAPTVLALTRPETGNHVKILCLSTGDSDGLGDTRKKELVKSAMSLGVRDEDDVFVVDNPTDFPDSMTTRWDENKIASLLCSAFAPHLAAASTNTSTSTSPRQRTTTTTTATSSSSSSSPPSPTANIDVLITFDAGGVSSHPNHVSLYHGARAFVAALVRGRDGWRSPVDLYALVSVGLARKYTSVADVAATLAGMLMLPKDKDQGGESAEQQQQQHPRGLVFMNALVGEGAALGTAWKAMTQAHKSQMVWFRYLWIGFSRYMLINDLRLEDVKAR